MNKSYEPKSFENRIYQDWIDKKYFHAVPNKDKVPFTIVIPPPNITGQLHMGHALNNAIQDSIIRYKRMKGFEALWLPGTDHASIATEVKIVDKMKSDGLTKEMVGRDGFLKLAYEWKDKYGGKIVDQLKKLGSSCDWDREAFTMDAKCNKAVREVFVNLYNKGLIYRGARIINWCPDCQTAISDAEVEFEPNEGSLWHIKYPVEGSQEFLTVATTRPETMLGDSAVAVNPNDKRYTKLIGQNICLPLTDRLIPIIADEYVDMKFGTGAVKITPAHDPNDFEVGLRHGLEVIRVMLDNATMNEKAGKYEGLDRFAARKKVLEDLTAMGLLVKTEKHNNNVGHCYRCHNIIEPIVSKQWFVKMQPLSEPAIKVVKDKEIEFLPKRFEKIYLHWMENIRDWCISRQLWWGHRIPAFYCESCSHLEVSKDDITVCPKCGGKLHQDEDVLDTWFSSALWPFSTLGFPDKTEDLEYFYPTSVLVTAYDIIFFWVARMIFSGLEHMNEKPFSSVLIHGIVRDASGRKMSKSLGNGIDPLEIIDTYGADTLRFSLVNGISAGGDIKYSAEKLDGYRNFMNKVWNASRFVLLNSDNCKLLDLGKAKKSIADMWILTSLNDCINQVTKYMDKFEVGLATSKLYDFVWNEFCDWYIELAKTSLYSDNEESRSSTYTVLIHVLTSILKLLHPVIPFITEEIYQSLPSRECESIMISTFPEAGKSYRKEYNNMIAVMDLIKSIRNTRQEMNVSQSKRTALIISPIAGYGKLIERCRNYIEKLGMGSGITIASEKPSTKVASIVTKIAEVYIPMGELIDFEKEIIRLEKELQSISNEITRAEGKLSNRGFTDKAPKSLIDQEKAKLEGFHELKVKIENNILAIK